MRGLTVQSGTRAAILRALASEPALPVIAADPRAPAGDMVA